ncbi:MAG: hypothetical protein IKQ46_09735 [Bacteroidales bacterium]|nr:hypothetical protein [Bacteroidales bacterium]
MKKTISKRLVWLASAAILATAQVGCEDDGFSAVDNQNPSIALEESLIHWEFSREFRVKGVITDADGIKTINLQNKDLYLNKTIDILDIYGSDVTSYELDYKITPNDTLAYRVESFPILITVEDLVGNINTTTFTAQMDGDFTDPKFTVEPSEVVNVIMPSFTLKFGVSDNVIIKKVVVDFPTLNLKEEIENTSKEYTYAKRIQVGDEYGDYEGVIAAYDAYDNKVEKKIIIRRSELQDYEKMYLCDVAEEDLTKDICGVPMRIDHTGEFEYTAYYYNETAGTGIRFLQQKDTYGPICFGKDPNSDLLTPDPDVAEPIILDKAGVYYKIVFNTKEGIYTATTYTIDEAVDPLHIELGSQKLNVWDDRGKWNAELGEWEDPDNNIIWGEFNIGILSDGEPKDVKDFFKYNPKNKHIIEILNYRISAGPFEFHPHNWQASNWWDYYSWKPEKATETDPEVWKWVGKYKRPDYDVATTSYNNAVEVGNHAKLTIPKPGKYDIIFDIHLGRMKIVPSKEK